jgi:hypothetical protein
MSSEIEAEIDADWAQLDRIDRMDKYALLSEGERASVSTPRETDSDEVTAFLRELDHQQIDAEQKRLYEAERETARERAVAREREEAERREAAEREWAEHEKAKKAEAKKRETEAKERLAAVRVLIKLSGNTYEIPWGAAPYTMIGRSQDGLVSRPLRQLVKQGELFTRDGKPITGDTRKRMKAMLLQKYDHLPLPGEVVAQTLDWLLAGLWRENMIPLLSGQYKTGRSMFVATELVSTLVVPGFRFLNHYEPISADHLAEIEQGGVWLINVEAPKADVEDALWPVDEADRWDFLTVDHLEDLGGAKMFDLTDPDIYEIWWHRLSSGCEVCDSSDFRTPAVVIVDGLTEILMDAGLSLETDSAKWFAAFKRLMKSLGIPYALVVGHATMKGDHAMGGTEFLGLPDGLWKYFSDNPDDPFSKRYFSVVPRGSGTPIPRSEVTLGEDGRLTLKLKKSRGSRSNRSNRSKPSSSPDEVLGAEEAVLGADDQSDDQSSDSVKEDVLDYVRRCNAQRSGPGNREIRANVAGKSPEIDKAVAELVDQAKLENRGRRGRGGGHAYWITDQRS